MKWSRVAISLGVCAVAATHVTAQSYTKLLTNGNGLALTRFTLQEQINGTWAFPPSVRQGGEYRLVYRITNYYPDVLSYGPHVRDIIRVSYSAQNGFALFYADNSYAGSGTKWVNGFDQAGLGPTQSKTYYQYFKWNGPTMATPTIEFSVNVTGSEVIALPNLNNPVRIGG
jgi:hypothetical protein